MRLTATILYLAVIEATVASTWFSKAAYNKWHETDLDRWLNDYSIPHPTPSDRKELQKLVEANWNNYVVAPYNEWDTAALTQYLKQKGYDVTDSTAANRDTLIAQVKAAWYETEEKSQTAWARVQDWILDTWSDSQLKAFADAHGIPVPQPQPRHRSTLIDTLRSNWDSIAKKSGEAMAYPGNWLYETWTESDLKEWLDKNGFPAPQPTDRGRLVAAVRRNSRLAYLKMQDQAASASASAAAAYETLTDKLIDSWGESYLKEFCDKNGIAVPHGSKTNELRALVRRQRAQWLEDTVSASANNAYGAATTKAGNEWAQATDSASLAVQDAFSETVNLWSDSRLKAYLDARGVPVPQPSKRDELLALVRKHHHQAVNSWNSWNFDSLSAESLRDYIEASGHASAAKVGAKRDDLVKAARSAYHEASASGGDNYASATSYLTKATAAARTNMFDSWNESELKSYLEGFGLKVPRDSKLNELKSNARTQTRYFYYGTTKPPSETLLGEMQDSLQWMLDYIKGFIVATKSQAETAKEKMKEEL